MLDIGWAELLLIGVVALIVVGPKDLPLLFRKLGEFTGRMRAMAREFSSAMDRAADEAGVQEVNKTLRGLKDPRKTGLDAINKAAREMTDLTGDDDWAEAVRDRAKTGKPAGAPAGPAPAAATAAAAGTPAAEPEAAEPGSSDRPA